MGQLIVEVKTEIAAPASAVYETLMDFPSYKEWNPMVVEASGESRVGEKIEVLVKIGTRAPSKFVPTVLVNEENKEFRWVGVLLTAFVYRGEHYFLIEDTPAGCVFTHGEKWTGIFEPLITALLGKEEIEASFKGFNEALKEHVEPRAQEQNQ